MLHAHFAGKQGSYSETFNKIMNANILPTIIKPELDSLNITKLSEEENKNTTTAAQQDMGAGAVQDKINKNTTQQSRETEENKMPNLE